MCVYVCVRSDVLVHAVFVLGKECWEEVCCLLKVETRL